MKINKETVLKAREVIAKKLPLWKEHFPQLEFDNDGRVAVAEVKAMNKYAIDEKLGNARGYESFMKCFNEYLKENEYTIRDNDNDYVDNIRVPWHLNTQDFIDNFCHFKKADGKHVKVKLSKVLAGVQAKWENLVPMYGVLVTRMKDLRKQGATYDDCFELRCLSRDKEVLERGNVYVMYQQIMNENAGSNTVYLSINPLDLLSASGQAGDNPTRFSSCWSIGMRKEDDGIECWSDGCYSDVPAQIALGSVLNRGMIMIKNNSTLKVDENDAFEFLGYKERSHIWLDTEGIWVEKIYPTKTTSRKAEIIDAIKAKGIAVIDPDIISDYEEFDIQDTEGLKGYFDAIYENHLFLDRVCIEKRNNYKLYYLESDRMDYDYENPDQLPNEVCYPTCYECSHRIDDDDTMYTTYDGDRVCQECYEEYYFTCASCGQIHHRRDANNVEGDIICDNCVHSVARRCSDCSEWHYIKNMTEVYDKWNDREYVCDSCLSDHYQKCDKCGKFYHEHIMYHIDGEDKHYCRNCKTDHVSRCVGCGKLFDDEHLTCVTPSRFACDDCKDKDEVKNMPEEQASPSTTDTRISEAEKLFVKIATRTPASYNVARTTINNTTNNYDDIFNWF